MKLQRLYSPNLPTWVVSAVVVFVLLWVAFGPSHPRIIVKEVVKWIEVPVKVPDPIEIPVYYPVEKIVDRVVYVVKRVQQHCESVADALNKYEQLK